jgi:hypothetical protein
MTNSELQEKQIKRLFILQQIYVTRAFVLLSSIPYRKYSQWLIKHIRARKGQQLLQAINGQNRVLQATLASFKDEKRKARRIEQSQKDAFKESAQPSNISEVERSQRTRMPVERFTAEQEDEYYDICAYILNEDGFKTCSRYFSKGHFSCLGVPPNPPQPLKMKILITRRVTTNSKPTMREQALELYD